MNALELLKKALRARQSYDALMFRNVYGLTPEERLEQDVAVKIAFDAWWDADAEYRRAVNQLAKEKADV